jgi:hypothetical protein
VSLSLGINIFSAIACEFLPKLRQNGGITVSDYKACPVQNLFFEKKDLLILVILFPPV